MQISQSVNFERTTKTRDLGFFPDEQATAHLRKLKRLEREKSIREGRKTKHLHSDMETI